MGERALLAQLSVLLDADAVNAAHRTVCCLLSHRVTSHHCKCAHHNSLFRVLMTSQNCLRKLDKYLETNKQNGEADEVVADPELAGTDIGEESNGLKEEEPDVEKAESERSEERGVGKE